MHRKVNKRAARKQAQGKILLLKTLLKVLPLTVAAVAILYLGNRLMSLEVPQVLPVEQVEVAGDLRFIDRGDIQKIIADNIDGGYFTVDLARIREQLLQQPWVKKVALRRRWPASLQVTIEEQKPLAYWNNDAYINQDGEIFQPQEIDRRLNLPQLNGPPGQQDKVWKFMNQLYREMAVLDYDVVRLDFDQRRAWQLQIVELGQAAAARVTIRLGRFDTEKRLQRFVRVLPALTRSTRNSEGIEYIDMRYPNGFAVKMIANSTEKDSTGFTGRPVPYNTNSRIASGGVTAAAQKGEA